MLEDLRRAWREAVDNFYRELRAEHESPGQAGRRTALQRDHALAGNALRHAEREARRARREADGERREAEVCRRRETMALRIEDAETARIAAEFAVQHTERAEVLDRVAGALEAEIALRQRELERMAAALAELGATSPDAFEPAPAAAGPAGPRRPTEEDDVHFRRLEREAREREAAAKLEELKRKLR
ncbi:MAG: hypothetical protein ACRELD_08965 [Longimicrobiales bacterium]